MPKFRKKPVVIDAWQWIFDSDCKEAPGWMTDALFHWPAIGSANFLPDGNEISPQPRIEIKTLEGTMNALPSDWIIKGVKGEIYPCKPDIFDATYEPAEG